MNCYIYNCTYGDPCCDEWAKKQASLAGSLVDVERKKPTTVCRIISH